MLNYKKLLVALAAFSTYSLVPSGRDTTTCSNVVAGTNQNVKGQTTNCTGGADEGGSLTDLVGLNAFKDRVSWTVKRNTPKQDLGKITQNKDFELMYPAVGKMNKVTFVPTQGRMANKKIEVLFVSFSIYNPSKNLELPADVTAKTNLTNQLKALKESGSPFNNLVKVYRKIGQETQWMELAEVYTKESPEITKMDTMWTIMPNGMAQANDTLYRTGADGVREQYENNMFDLTIME